MKLLYQIHRYIVVMIFLTSTCFFAQTILLHAKVIKSDAQPTAADQPNHFIPYDPANKHDYFSYQYQDPVTGTQNTYYVLTGYVPGDTNDVREAANQLLKQEEQL